MGSGVSHPYYLSSLLLSSSSSGVDEVVILNNDQSLLLLPTPTTVVVNELSSSSLNNNNSFNNMMRRRSGISNESPSSSSSSSLPSSRLSSLAPKKLSFEHLPSTTTTNTTTSLTIPQHQQVSPRNKIYLEPISQNISLPIQQQQQNLAPQQELSPSSHSQSIMRRSKFNPSPRSSMKDLTDKLPNQHFLSTTTTCCEKKIQLPPIELFEIPHLIIESPSNANKSHSSHHFKQPQLKKQTTPVDLIHESVSDDIVEFNQYTSLSISPSPPPRSSSPSSSSSSIKRQKLDECIQMKQCKASEEIARLEQYRFPLLNKLILH